MSRNIYLALGDSITAGHGATHPSLSFVRHVSNFTRKRKLSERTFVIARNGWTTKDVLNAAYTANSTLWDETNVLTLMTGGNDLRKLLRRQYFSISGLPIPPRLVHQKLGEFGLYMNQLCGFLVDRKIPHVIIATVYNPIPNLPLAEDALNSLKGITCEIASQYHFDVVDIYEQFHDKEAYYIDGYRAGRFEDLASPIRRPIHPNNAGHKEIADLITKRLLFRVSNKPRHSVSKNRVPHAKRRRS